jgi:hypothetical protein
MMNSKTDKSLKYKQLDSRRKLKIWMNVLSVVALGKAAVSGAGLALVLYGYADLARPILPQNAIEMIQNGISLSSVAGVGSTIGVILALIVSLIK